MKVDICTQLSVVATNQPGEVARIIQVLSDHQINIGSIMFVDTTSQGVVRFVVERAAEAKKALEDAGFFVAAAEVAVVEVPNEIGSLLKITQALGQAGINIDYAYGSDNPSPGHIRDTLKLSDLEKGVGILRKL